MVCGGGGKTLANDLIYGIAPESPIEGPESEVVICQSDYIRNAIADKGLRKLLLIVMATI